ncbi:MAG: hypothetical protein U0821_21420 [Chloroflexota bacterium]
MGGAYRSLSAWEALEGAGVRDVQFLPARVEHMDGTAIPDYFILNITVCVNPIRDPDPMPRTLERIGERSTWADRVILPWNLLEAHDALRSRPWEPTVYESQRFKDALRPVLLREFGFIPVAVAWKQRLVASVRSGGIREARPQSTLSVG